MKRISIEEAGGWQYKDGGMVVHPETGEVFVLYTPLEWELLNRLKEMKALVHLKYGNLDPDVNILLENAQNAIDNAEEDV